MTEMKKGKLFVMSGPSGTGKGTICKELLKKENVFLSVSNTTREMREGEQEGVTYFYVSKEEFEKLIKDGEMLEYAQYSENYYGTSRMGVEKAMSEGKDVLLEIEPQGALKVKALLPEAILIFIVPPTMAELKRRLIARGRESMELIEKRLDAARWELTQAEKYNHIIINDNLEVCVEEVRALFHKKIAELDQVEALLAEKY